MKRQNPLERLLQSLATKPESPVIVDEIPCDLVFDDEPLDGVLYGEVSREPTPASLFAPARQLLQRIGTAESAGAETKVRAVLTFLDDEHAMNRELFESLAGFSKNLLPRWPNPPSPDMPPSLGLLLFRLWEEACRVAIDDWKVLIGQLLWEWHEYQCEFAQARAVLAELADIQRLRGDTGFVATHIHNLAYQHFLEGNWEDGAREFERAGRLHKTEYQIANTMMNYWACRIENNDVPSLEVAREQLERYLDVMRTSRSQMGQRKCLIYLGRLRAADRDYPTAIELVSEAIAIDEAQNAMFLHADKELLSTIKRQASSTS